MNFKEIVENTHDGICIIRQDNRIIYYNQAFSRLVGYNTDELLNRDLGIVLPHEISITHADIIKKYIESSKKESSVLGKLRKLEVVHKNGDILPIELLAFEISPDTDNSRVFVGVFRDLREREQISLEYNRLLYDMDKLGYMDDLTKLPNQKFIKNRLEGILQHHANYRESIFALIDIDGLEFINQKYGRDIGDNILKKVGLDLRTGLPLKDILGRSEDFDYSCIFPESTLSEVINLIENFRNQLSRKRGLIPGEINYSISVSVGVTRILNPVRTFSDYFSEAKLALKKAKNEGKNKLFIHGFY